MKTRSAKHKGRRLTTAVRKVILEQFPQLEDDDVQVAVRSEPGTDIKLSPLARSVFPYSVECKNVERLNIWSALSQAQANTKEGTTALLVFSRNVKAGYRISPHLRAYANATDLLNQQRFQIFGGSVIGRRVLAGMTSTF